MVKGRNDNNQVSREDYEAQQLREEMEGGDSNQMQSGFTRASAEVMKSRRIARVSSRNRFKRSAGAGAGLGPSIIVPGASGNNGAVPTPNVFTPKAGTTSNGSAPKNQFANTILSTDNANNNTNNNNNNQEEGTKPNPFATFSFNSNASKPKSSSAFSFSTSSTTTSKQTETTTTTNNENNTSQNGEGVVPLLSEGTLLNLSMLRMAQLEGKANPLSDWSRWMKIYLKEAQALKEKEEQELKENTTASVTPPSTTTTAPSSSAFSFGTSSTTTNTAAAASTAPKFSLSVPASTTAASTTASTTTKPAIRKFKILILILILILTTPTTPTKTITKTEDIDKIAKVSNEDDEELYACRTKYLKFIKSEEKMEGICYWNVTTDKIKNDTKGTNGHSY